MDRLPSGLRPHFTHALRVCLESHAFSKHWPRAGLGHTVPDVNKKRVTQATSKELTLQAKTQIEDTTREEGLCPVGSVNDSPGTKPALLPACVN
jgi:RNA:NAD 2'-phosphotransferase (TPT1/KptA family)